MIERSFATSIGSKSCAFNSVANSCSKTAFAASADFTGTQKLMLYSEDDCVIKITEIPAFDIAENTRAAIPTIPCIPGPETLNIATLSRLVIPFTCNPSDFTWPSIMEPGANELPVFLITQGICFGNNGPIVRGWITFAPK